MIYYYMTHIYVGLPNSSLFMVYIFPQFHRSLNVLYCIANNSFCLRWLFEGFISAIIHLQTPNTHHHQLCTSIITLSNWAAQMHSGNRWIFVCMEKKIIYDMMDDYLTELWWMITLQNYQTFKDSKILSSLASNFCGFNIINLILLPLEFVLN